MMKIDGLQFVKQDYKFKFLDKQHGIASAFKLNVSYGKQPLFDVYLKVTDTDYDKTYLIANSSRYYDTYLVISEEPVEGLEEYRLYPKDVEFYESDDITRSYTPVIQQFNPLNVLTLEQKISKEEAKQLAEASREKCNRLLTSKHLYLLLNMSQDYRQYSSTVENIYNSELLAEATSSNPVLRNLLNFLTLHDGIGRVYYSINIVNFLDYMQEEQIEKEDVISLLEFSKYYYEGSNYNDILAYTEDNWGEVDYLFIKSDKSCNAKSIRRQNVQGLFIPEEKVYTLEEIKTFNNILKISKEKYKQYLLSEGEGNDDLEMYPMNSLSSYVGSYGLDHFRADAIKLLVEGIEYLPELQNVIKSYDSDADLNIDNIFTYLCVDSNRNASHECVTSDILLYTNSVQKALPFLQDVNAFCNRMNSLVRDSIEQEYNFLHDIKLVLDILLKIMRSPKLNDSLLNALLKYDYPDYTNLNTISMILNSTKPSTIESMRSQLISELTNNKGILNLRDYETFFRASKSNEVYLEALEVCNVYASLDLATLKKGVTLKRLSNMYNGELDNILKPCKISGSDLYPTIFEESVNALLDRGDKSVPPTAEQKKLYFLTKNVDYNNLSEQQTSQILEQMQRIDKQKVDLLLKISQYTFEVLDKNDYRNIIIGDATQCCMNAGTSKQKTYTAAPCFNQCIITNTEENKIVVSSVLWIDMQNYLVLDNIEAIQNSTLNNLIYRTFFSEILPSYCEDNNLNGYVQGAYNNDVKLYPAEAQSINQLICARGTDNILYQGFYSDATKVYNVFTNPLTDEQYEVEHLQYMDIRSFH